MEKKKFFSAKNLVYLAVLLALVIVLQCLGGFFKIGTTSLSFVLVPIVLGAVLIGWWAGAFLGFAFGFIVLMYGVAGTDPFTNILVVNQPVLTTLTCLIKGIAAGLVPGLIYPLIAKKNKLAGVIVASALAPIMNTGFFIIGALCMSGTISTNFVEEGSTLVYFLFIACAGINFLVEFAINILLSPAIHRVILVVEKQIKKKKKKPEYDESAFREVEGEVRVIEDGRQTALPDNQAEILPETELKALPEENKAEESEKEEAPQIETESEEKTEL